jgi:hypothetical protein
MQAKFPETFLSRPLVKIGGAQPPAGEQVAGFCFEIPI